MPPGVDEHVPLDLHRLYDIFEYRHAAAILAAEFPQEFRELCDALLRFRFSATQILAGGGNESAIPKVFSRLLRPAGWHEGKLTASLVVDSQPVRTDSHKIDYVKGRVAFDLEWNSKDQTFDRDLYAFRAFFEYDRISVGVLVTRSTRLDALFRRLGVLSKYGASTTHTGKLLPRLNAGRSGGCPVLVFGITERLLDTSTP